MRYMMGLYASDSGLDGPPGPSGHMPRFPRALSPAKKLLVNVIATHVLRNGMVISFSHPFLVSTNC